MIHYNVWFSFRDNVVDVGAVGIHTGLHGFMIENVDTFIVEIFEEMQ